MCILFTVRHNGASLNRGDICSVQESRNSIKVFVPVGWRKNRKTPVTAERHSILFPRESSKRAKTCTLLGESRLMSSLCAGRTSLDFRVNEKSCSFAISQRKVKYLMPRDFYVHIKFPFNSNKLKARAF